MLKVNKKAITPVYITELKAGDTFFYNDCICMRILFNSMFYTVNLETGKVMTNIHNDVRVRVVNCDLIANV